MVYKERIKRKKVKKERKVERKVTDEMENNIPGGREFVWQCIIFLLEINLITFTIVGILIIVVLSIIKAIIKVKENK